MLATMLTALGTLMLAAGPVPHRDDYPKNPNIDIEHYRFALEVTDADDVLHGEAEVTARILAGGDTVLRLDLASVTTEREGKGMTVTGAWAGDTPLAFRHAGDELLVRLARPTVAGERLRLRVAYHGRPAEALRIGPNRHGDRTFFSDNWPNRARHWLPTVDHPYDKATSEMVVTAPAHYQVVSNGLLVEERDLGDGRRLTHWRQSVPIATWLYALGVAEFAVEHRGRCEGVPIETWVAWQDRDAGFHDFAEPTCDVLAYFGRRVGPFAYERLANIVSPSVGGGMEAATAIFYGERSVTGTRAVNWQNVIIHELAHQWFGNAVTEADWDDVWLSEGFATYFTLLYREHARGRDDFVAGLRESRDRIRTFYAERPDYRVVHENLTDMAQVTTAMTYQKGAWTLHMLRTRVGDEAFWRGIQAYYREFMNQNATTADFRRVMEEASGQPLGAFLQQWLEQGGVPALTVAWRHDAAAGEAVLTVTESPSAHPFRLPVEVDLVAADGTRVRATVEVGPGAPGVRRVPMATPPVAVEVDPETRLLATWTVVTPE